MMRGFVAFAAALVAAGAAPAQAQQGPPVPALLEPTFLLATPRIVDGDDFRGEGEILGSTRELAIRDQSLTAPDRVFVPRTLRGRLLAPGDVVQFYRIERVLTDPWTGERLGRLFRPTGIGSVDSIAADVARVRITHGFHPVQVGDYARAVEQADTLVTVRSGPAPGVAEGPVVASPDDQAILPPFERIFLRTAHPHELSPGDVVAIDRPGEVVNGARLPDVSIARAMVVRVEGRIVAAVITEMARSDLVPGDRFRLEDPPAE